MIPPIELAVVVGVLFLIGALVAHWTQLARAAHAERLRVQRGAQAAARAGEVAQQAAQDERRRTHPYYYISRERGRIAYEQGRLSGPIADLRARLAAAKEALAATPEGTQTRELLKCVGLVFLALAFALSAAQLIPSFQALAAASASAENVVLGVIVAAIEVFVALILAHYLRPEHGWRSLAPKVAAAIATTFAMLVMGAQLEWAPAHDTVPLRAQLAAARETLAQDRQANAGSTVATTDRQQISNLQDRLTRATERDQALAVMVTLGADVSAWPGLGALGFLAALRRRRRLRREVTAIQSRLNPLTQEYDLIPIRATYEVQAELERLCLNPDLVIAAPASRALPGPGAEPPPTPRGEPLADDIDAGRPAEEQPPAAPPNARPGTTGTTGSSATQAGPTSGEAGSEAVTPNTLFPADDDGYDDWRWTDPL